MSTIKEFLDTFQETMPHHLRAEASAEVYSHLEAVAQERSQGCRAIWLTQTYCPGLAAS
jgi:hypothetical protein